MPNRLLVANRGEIACRIIRACNELGWETVAVYSEDDAAALHVTMADQTVPLPGKSARETYANPAALLQAAKQSGAGFVHPGYGFLSENHAFARDVTAAGLVWVGPTAATIEEMGDKARARSLAEAAGVPVLPGSARLSPGQEVDPEWLEQVGMPLLVKATAGGGGMGMRVVNQRAELTAAITAVQAQAARLFNDPAVVIERYVQKSRHIEVQVFGFGDGNAVHLYERDCSIQRRFQKMVEESPAANLPESTRLAMCEAAVSLARSRHYASAGTVEFLYDPAADRFYFLEMNTRIQVEHPVTELVTGIDLVQTQLQFAANEMRSILQQDDIAIRRHAIEFRLCAEDPAKTFRPSPGKLASLTFPAAHPELRIDCGFQSGDTISPLFDSLIAKIICSGPTRDEALRGAREALAQVSVSEIATNLNLLQRICEHSAFLAGAYTTDYLGSNLTELLTAESV